jgi:hypothetical protein
MDMRRNLWAGVLLMAALGGSGCNCGKPPPTVEDSGVVANGHTGTSTVAGGVKASSPNYKLVGTTAPSGGTPSSPSFQLRSGVVGATQPTENP